MWRMKCTCIRLRTSLGTSSQSGSILLRQYDVLDAESGGGQNFFLDSAHAHNTAAQADFPGHRHIRPDPPLGQQRSQRGDQTVTPALGPSFGVAPAGHVNVNVVFAVIRNRSRALGPGCAE